MKKMLYCEGHIYGFGGLLSRFLRRYRVKEEDLDSNYNGVDFIYRNGLSSWSPFQDIAAYWPRVF